MSAALARVARSLSQHWKRSLLVAIFTIIVLGIAAGNGSPAADDFDAPGTESQQALDLFREHQPALAGADSTIVFSTESGKLSDAPKRAAIQKSLTAVKDLDGVVDVSDPFTPGGSVSEDGRIASVDVRYDTEPGDIEKEDGEAFEEAARTGEGAGVDVSMRGLVVDIGQEQEAPVGELVGIAIALVLLTVLFRSAAAMGATLLGALLGVVIGQMLLTALAGPLGLPEFATTIAVMLGLGAGIDYSLLIIARYREQAAAGDSVRDAAAKAAGTAGASVVAAGLIVMVAIAGLLVVGIPAIGRMGIGAAIGVAAVVVSALTILPIMIGAFARWLKPKKPEHVLPSRGFERWGERITGRPWAAIAAGVAILLVFAFPVTDMRLGQPDDGNQSESKTQRVAYDKLSDAFGPGSNGPFLLAVDTPKGDGQTREQLQRIEADVRRTPGIASVTPAAPSRDGEMAVIVATPTTSPQDERTSELLERLRGDVLPAATQGTPLKVYVGGNTPGFEDFSDKVSSRLPLFIALVIGLSVLLLIAAFRSLWIPLVSAVFNLLSIVAAYGVVTAVFQDGVGASLIGVDSGVPIISFVPVMMFAILFGLSMDYNVFLLSRIHEAYNEGDGPRASVIHGMGRIAKVVLFAGLIMSAVFSAFVTTDDVISKMFGLGLGLAILIDVLIVRLVIAPAVVTLLGDKAWWLPGWLDRILPNVSLEGHLVEALDRPAEQRQPAPAG
ncbi:MMPL family transporter [Conexibacter sp. SYSU D00693]|uniref:MMPL family transporter n=1 Tax=Conexibacter sp. SYSU D00693 TaxID=2812560 RepID=UPI00196B94D0|nr:MMPL family transporter [Conexibacter sp. SYSU D00693]